jgi:hypothetical protein
MGMTEDQISSAIRWVLTASSGVLSGLLISKGWATAESGAALTAFLLGLAPSIAAFIWGLWAHSANSTIASASALPDVHIIVTTPNIAHSTQFVADDKVITPAENSQNSEFANQTVK